MSKGRAYITATPKIPIRIDTPRDWHAGVLCGIGYFERLFDTSIPLHWGTPSGADTNEIHISLAHGSYSAADVFIEPGTGYVKGGILELGQEMFATLAPNHSEFASHLPWNEARTPFLCAIVAHELGHIYGLRHNFLASTQGFSWQGFVLGTSVMDYYIPQDRVSIGKAIGAGGLLPYDVKALAEVPEPSGDFCHEYFAEERSDCQTFDPIRIAGG